MIRTISAVTAITVLLVFSNLLAQVPAPALQKTTPAVATERPKDQELKVVKKEGKRKGRENGNGKGKGKGKDKDMGKGHDSNKKHGLEQADEAAGEHGKHGRDKARERGKRGKD